MTASTAVIKTVILLWLCCHYCYSSQVSQESTKTPRYHHVHAKSSTNGQQRIEHQAKGMPVVSTVVVAGTAVNGTAAAGGQSAATSSSEVDENNVMLLRDYLIRNPSNIFNSLLRTNVDLVQHGMDTFQGVSTKLYKTARKVTNRPTNTRYVQRDTLSRGSKGSHRRSGRFSGVASDGKASGYNRKMSDNGKSINGTVGRRRKPSIISTVSNSIVSKIDTGIAGMEQVTDLSLLLGNIGTHKFRATLDGKNGNQEIFKLLVRYVGTRVGMGTKLSASEFLDNVGNVSTFIATDDKATEAISTLMVRLMNDPEASASMVRLAVMLLESSPSTLCILDQLPLTPADIRMAFDVFVGSNGQVMMSTIARLVSNLTTGPDTRAFLESILGMMSMFRSDSSDSEKSEKPKSMVGSIKDFFTNTDEVDDDDDYNEKVTKQKQKLKPKLKPKRAKNENQVNVKGSKLKPSVKPPLHEEDPWFSDFGSDSFDRFDSFSTGSKLTKSSETKTKSLKSDVEARNVIKVTEPNINEVRLSAANTDSAKKKYVGKEKSNKVAKYGGKDKPLDDKTANIKLDDKGNKSKKKKKSSRRKKSSGSKSMEVGSGSLSSSSGSLSSGSLSASDYSKVESPQKSKMKSHSNTVINFKDSNLASFFGLDNDGSEFEDFWMSHT